MNAEMNRVLRQMARKIDETVAEEKKMVFGRMVDVEKKSPAERRAAKISKSSAAKKRVPGVPETKKKPSGPGRRISKTARNKPRFSRSKD